MYSAATLKFPDIGFSKKQSKVYILNKKFQKYSFKTFPEITLIVKLHGENLNGIQFEKIPHNIINGFQKQNGALVWLSKPDHVYPDLAYPDHA